MRKNKSETDDKPITDASTEPSKEQIEALLGGNKEGPFHFVNLLRFKQKAAYLPDHPLAQEQLSGAEAYSRYGEVALQQVTMRGGRLVALNTVQQQLIGNGRHWHQVAIMEYQTVDAFIAMVSDSDYQQALVHRNAGLEATEVFVTRPLLDQLTA